MSAEIIDGKKVADLTIANLRKDVEQWVERGNRRPFLKVVQVGNDPASSASIGSKTNACKKVGIDTDTTQLPDTVSAKDLKKSIIQFNNDDSIAGNLVQLPLPSHLSSHYVIERIDYSTDVLDFHLMYLGRLSVD